MLIKIRGAWYDISHIVKKQDGDKIEVSLEDLQNFIEGVVEAELDEIDILEYARA